MKRSDKEVEIHEDDVQRPAEIQGFRNSHMPFSGPQDIMWAFGPSDADPGTLEWKPLGGKIINDSIEWDKQKG